MDGGRLCEVQGDAVKAALLILAACAHAPYVPPPGDFSAEIDRLLAPVAMYASVCPWAPYERLACVLVGGAHVTR